MDDLTTFVTARLDDWETGADEDKRDNGQCDDLTGWHMEAADMRRLVDSLRAIAAEHRDTWNDYKDGDGIERTSHECRSCDPSGSPDDWPCPTIRAVASAWSDHPDYRPEWAPEP